MLNEERKNELLRLIGQTGYIEVEKLSEKLFISSSTIRRNLTELEKQGLVKRSYGAVELSDTGLLAPLKLRLQKNHAEKQVIAEKASKYLKDNAMIFIDGSSTCLYLVPYMSKFKNITVYTNSLEICSMLKDAGVNVFCTGGKLLPKSLAFVGEYALEMMEKLNFDMVFFSAAGLSNDIISDISEEETFLRRKLIGISKEKYFLCDKSKLGEKFNFIVCKANEVSAIISEDGE